MNRIYFPGLNGIRFIAAFLVIMFHVEVFKEILGLANYRSVPFFSIIGHLGVILFFVLSGFLITYLLLSEKEKTGTISVKHFYIRRILRIWPLYFFLIIVGSFILPMIPFFDIGGFLSQQNSDFAKRLILFIAFLPNLAYVLFSQSLYISQSWSIGVEEQFYLIWPVLIKKIKNKELLFYSIIISYVAVKIIAYEVITTFYFLDSTVISLWTLFYATSIDCMAIGGIFALYLFRKDKKLTFLFNRTVQFVTLSILIISLGFGIELPRIHFEFYAILFGIVILNVAGNPRSIINLENRVFNYLGKISYGLYMYQAITIVITLKALMLLGIKNPFVQHFCSLIVTIIIAGLSYRLYESYFINKKIKFSKIVSGDNAASVTVNDKTN